MTEELAALIKATSRYVSKRREVDKRFAAMPQPSKDLVIFMTPRSGSTWLSDVLTLHRGFGRPVEWFNPESFWHYFSLTESASLGRYMRHIRALTKDQNTGVFSTQLTFHQFEFADRISSFFEVFDPSRTVFFFLVRRDVAAQAVSLFKAKKTGIWHSRDDIPPQKEEDVQYDENGLMKLVEMLLEEEAGFELMFKEMDIRPTRLIYEDMVDAGAERICKLFCDRVGVDFKETPHPEIKKLATSTNEDFAARLVSSLDMHWVRERPWLRCEQL